MRGLKQNLKKKRNNDMSQYSDEEFQWDCDHERVQMWECPNKCGYSYDADPWQNKGLKCPECGVPCVEGSTRYRG